jgi:hypothetical protein
MATGPQKAINEVYRITLLVEGTVPAVANGGSGTRPFGLGKARN